MYVDRTAKGKVEKQKIDRLQPVRGDMEHRYQMRYETWLSLPELQEKERGRKEKWE